MEKKQADHHDQAEQEKYVEIITNMEQEILSLKHTVNTLQ